MAFSSRLVISLVALATALAAANAERHVVHFTNKLRCRPSALSVTDKDMPVAAVASVLLVD